LVAMDGDDEDDETVTVRTDPLDDRMVLVEKDNKLTKFELDYVFGCRSTQEQVFVLVENFLGML